MTYPITTITRRGTLRKEWVWLHNDLITANLGRATYHRVSDTLWAAKSVPKKTIRKVAP